MHVFPTNSCQAKQVGWTSNFLHHASIKDIDGDGVVGPTDYFVAKTFGKERQFNFGQSGANGPQSIKQFWDKDQITPSFTQMTHHHPCIFRYHPWQARNCEMHQAGHFALLAAPFAGFCGKVLYFVNLCNNPNYRPTCKIAAPFCDAHIWYIYNISIHINCLLIQACHMYMHL